jgi:4-amino-4-deoxy-L-arabinose transferase-like glycosyltransferase
MKKWGREIIIIASLFSLTLLPRFYRLSETPLYPDEITWMVRAKETSLALRTLNFNYFSSAWWNIINDTESIALPLTVSVGFPIIYLGKGQSVLSYNLFQDYIVGRSIVIIISSIFIVLYYLFAQKYFGKKVALLSSLLFTLDPIFTANSKLILNDLYLTLFIFFSISTYLLIKNKKLSVFLSSLGLTASFLTKPHGILLIPVFFLQIFINRENRKQQLGKFIVTFMLFIVFVSLLWPSSWSNPVFAVPEYLLRQITQAGEGINNYFLGNITENPPFYYYLFQLMTRLPPLIILGFLGFLIILIRNKDKSHKTYKYSISILAFMFIFITVVSLSPKKLGVRYILPLWPWIYLFAGKTILFITNRIKYPFLKIGFILTILIYFLFIAIYYFPHEYLYYNDFIGGTKNAQKYDLVGLCLGSKAAIDYVGACYPSIRKVAVLGCGRTTIPYYYPNPINYDWKNESVLIIENYYLQLEKDKEVVEFYNNNYPTHTINIKGAKLAQIYVRGNPENKCK